MTTLVDRLLRKFNLLPKVVVAASASSALAQVKRIEDLRNIPRYPPFMEGLPVHAPWVLLTTQKELTGGIQQLIANQELLETHYNPAMLRLATLVQLLPASQAHHHRGAGGMLRHSLEVGLWSLQQTEGKLIRGVVTPQQRRVIEPRWRLTVFLAGLCHDLGKVVTDLTVTDRENSQKWRPYNQSLYDWAISHGIENYFLHWQEGRGKKHTHVSSTLIDAVISKETLDWISDGSTDALIWLTESLNNNPGSSNQIHNFVVRADQLSVERDLKSMGAAMAGYEIGVPIERYLTDIMRRLVQEGIWRINEPSARVWNIEGITYLVWPMAGEEIARRTRDEDIPGLPKTPDGILDMMIEREIAFLREAEGDPFFYIAPDVITEKIPDMRLKAIRLRDQALISSMPIPPISGQIHSSKASSQNVPSTSVEHVERAEEMPPQPQHVSSTSVERVAEKMLSLDSLEGAMGELLRVLIGEFNLGKKSFADLGVKHANGCVYLKWPDTFAGYGFTPKQILTELSDMGWMIPASEVAKIGDAIFSSGVAKAIRLTADVGKLFVVDDKPVSEATEKTAIDTVQPPSSLSADSIAEPVAAEVSTSAIRKPAQRARTKAKPSDVVVTKPKPPVISANSVNPNASVSTPIKTRKGKPIEKTD
ncbi:MAG: MobH family relaxase [Gallionella sp.]|nr:MobH family relaxase [Gallionella sp.]